MKISFLLLASGLVCAGCSQTTPAPSQANTAQALINSVTNNARGSRNAARALRSDSDKRLASGDYNGAMDKRLEMLQAPDKSSSTLSAFTGYAIQSLALADLGKIASHLDAPSCLKYAEQLKAIDERVPSYAASLERQKASELKLFATISADPQKWRRTIQGLGNTPDDRDKLKRTSIAQIKANIESVYDQAIKQASAPYSYTAPKTSTSVDPYTELFASPSPLRRFLWAKFKTERLLTIVALQQRAYQLEKRKRTEPFPADPFGSGPLNAKNGTIYSVGPDTKDDGGQSFSSPTPLQPSTKGDILAPKF